MVAQVDFSSPLILTRVPAGSAFDAAASAARESGARVFRDGHNRLVEGSSSSETTVLIAAEQRLANTASSTISALASAGNEVWVEIFEPGQAVEALEAGASGLVACGL